MISPCVKILLKPRPLKYSLSLSNEKTKIKFFDIIRCKLNLQYQVADYDKNNYQCPLLV